MQRPAHELGLHRKRVQLPLGAHACGRLLLHRVALLRQLRRQTLLCRHASQHHALGMRAYGMAPVNRSLRCMQRPKNGMSACMHVRLTEENRYLLG